MAELTIQATKVFEKNWNANGRFIVNIGGSRSTKTYSILQLLIVQSLQTQEHRTISIVRKSFPSLRISVMRDFFEILNTLNLYDEQNHNKSENSYKINNTTIEFFSIDDPQKRRGSKRDILYINEANELTWEDFFQLQIRTTEKVYLDFNPSSYFWFNTQLEKREDVAIIHSTYKDNPFLNQEQIQEIERLQHTDEQYYKIYALGQFAGSMDLIYNFNIVEQIPQEAKLVGLGMDFGYTNDPTAVVEVYKLDQDIYVQELLYSTNLTNQDIAKELESLGIDKYTEIIADSAEPKSIEELYRMGYNVKPAQKGPDSIKKGIDILKHHKINVVKTSYNTIKELNNYKWLTDKNGNTINKPVDMFNHSMDALRYLALNKLGQQKKGGIYIKGL